MNRKSSLVALAEPLSAYWSKLENDRKRWIAHLSSVLSGLRFILLTIGILFCAQSANAITLNGPLNNTSTASPVLSYQNYLVEGGGPDLTAISKRKGRTRRVIVQLANAPVSAYQRQIIPHYTHHTRLTQEEQQTLRSYARYLVGEQNRVLARWRKNGSIVAVTYRYTYLLNGFAVTIPAKVFKRLAAAPDVRAVYVDRMVHETLSDSVPLIGAPTLWNMTDQQGSPVRGHGIRVAIVDTGVDYTHPDLGGCFGSGCKVAGGYDFVNNDADPWDDEGHGTHVAGIIAANGTVVGVAPDATLYAYKVLDASGSGSDSAVIAGIERAMDPDQNPITNDGAQVINLSLGGPGDPNDAVSQAVNAAVDAGTVVVVAAGNDGDKGYFTIGSPGTAVKALTVGASDKNDILATFSSRGPVPSGWLLKPDILAPGVAIRSTVPGGGYEAWSGTSMATPHMAGAAVLLRQLHPDWPPLLVKAVLMNNALDLGREAISQGTGRVQLPPAASPWAIVEPASLSFGLLDTEASMWQGKEVFAITNPVDSTATYTVSIAPGLPAGMTATVSSSTVILPPGVSVQVTSTLQVDNRMFSPPGSPAYTTEGTILIEKAGAGAVRVPFIAGVLPNGDSYEPDNTYEQASPIETNGTIQTHNFHVQGDEDWISFHAQAGAWYRIETGNLGSACDTVLHLYGPDGTTELAYNDDGGVGLASLINWQAPTSGTYFACVHDYDADAMGPNTSYDVWVSIIPAPQPDAYEPDNGPDQATYITTDGTRQTHNFHVPGDQDWLTFTATVGISYTVETGNLGFNGDTVLGLYAPDGRTQIALNDDKSPGDLASQIVWTASTNGIYFVQVRHYDSRVAGEDTRYDIWIKSSCTLPYDFDGDHVISSADLTIVADHWRQHNRDSGWNAIMDVDNDGAITVMDILQVGTSIDAKCP